SHLADFGATAVDEISLVETDAAGRWIHVELFAPDRLGDAVVRLYQRNAELLAEGPERERGVATARSVAVVAPGGFDRNRYAAAFRPDVEIVDRRLLGLGAGVGLDMLFRSMTATSEVADQVASRPQDVLALTHDALLLRWLVSGVGRESGGAFEWAFLRLFVFDADGRVARYELFDADREGEALARFDALAGRSPEVLEEPFANAASRYNDRFVRAWDARDWNAVREIHRPTCRVDDRRRMMRIEGPAEDGFRFYFDQPRSRWIVTPIATRGERLVLSRLLLECDVEAEGGAAAIDYLCVDEVDADGLSAAMVVFDPDDEDAAYAELDARFEVDPGAVHGRVVGEFVRAIAGRDWDAVAALCSPAFVEHDHRSLAVLGTTRGAEAWVQNFRALVELAPDTIYRSLHVRTAERGFLSVGTWQGSREGGRYEIPLVAVLELNAHGAIARADLYEPDQQDQALARFRELETTTPSRFANAASRANRKRIECFNARDWAGVESCVSADLVFEERRRLLHNAGDKDVWLAQTRLLFDLPESRFAIELLATRGERLSLHRHEFEGTVPDGGGPLALDPHLALHEVDADGRIVAIVLFDLEDQDAAWAELDARYDVLEAELHPRMTAARIAQRRPYLDRDWEAFAATYAPDVACHDHRVLGWGTLHGVDAFMRTQRALVELAPDTRVRNDHVMASEHGFLVSALISGTRDGGAFELAFLRVCEIDAAGRMCRIDLYDIEDQGRALARFGELGPAGAEGAAFENAASAIMEHLIAAVVANDWMRYEALFTETVRCFDRRRMVRLDFDRDAQVAFARELAEGRRARGESTTLATRGERLALTRGTFVFEDADVGPSEVDSLLVLEVDASGRIAAYVRFDLDDLDAACAELDARFEAGEG
ncbi:MAG: nuclear transport factor 2 family protein, partial [Myxococcota bacterium]|nr:nuclear transport factor 2 family protein [Myxococcota bacterium]